MGDVIRRYLSAITAAIIAALGAMLYLRGRKDARQKQVEYILKAAKHAKDNHNEMESQDDQRLVDILTGKLRDGKR